MTVTFFLKKFTLLSLGTILQVNIHRKAHFQGIKMIYWYICHPQNFLLPKMQTMAETDVRYIGSFSNAMNIEDLDVIDDVNTEPCLDNSGDDACPNLSTEDESTAFLDHNGWRDIYPTLEPREFVSPMAGVTFQVPEEAKHSPKFFF